MLKQYFCIPSTRDDKLIRSFRNKFCTKYVCAVPSLNRMQKLPTRIAPDIYLHNKEVLMIFCKLQWIHDIKPRHFIFFWFWTLRTITKFIIVMTTRWSQWIYHLLIHAEIVTESTYKKNMKNNFYIKRFWSLQSIQDESKRTFDRELYPQHIMYEPSIILLFLSIMFMFLSLYYQSITWDIGKLQYQVRLAYPCIVWSRYQKWTSRIPSNRINTTLMPL